MTENNKKDSNQNKVKSPPPPNSTPPIPSTDDCNYMRRDADDISELILKRQNNDIKIKK